METSIIISTYNHPKWLYKVLIGFSCQTHLDFEIIIADDGSSEETLDIINKAKQDLNLNIKHVWQEDQGFRKTEILNKAILASSGKYLIFTDGDCIPREDFVQSHLHYSEKGYFLSGGALRLPMETSRQINISDINKQYPFSKKWLLNNGTSYTHKLLKLTLKGKWAKLMNFITPTKATWNGGNASVWRENIFSINGFDEDMRYGAEDREFGSRLENLGLKSKQIRYSAICVHLDHGREYKNPADLAKNKAIWKKTKKDQIIKVRNGLIKD